MSEGNVLDLTERIETWKLELVGMTLIGRVDGVSATWETK